LTHTGAILGVETSCDETGVALYHPEHGLLGERLHSQVALHAEYGGVVPELASRDHIRRLAPLIRSLLEEAGVARPAGVAYTAGPGLAGALLVGAAVARSLAWAWGVPAVAVHHMEGHLLAPRLEPDPPAFPFVALLVSGGHTQLVAVAGLGRYRLLGDTLDDAAGEAFDKVAKMLGLGYPGGPAVAALAERGCPGRFRFPRPMTDRPGLDFSFSGLKTAVLNAVEAAPSRRRWWIPCSSNVAVRWRPLAFLVWWWPAGWGPTGACGRGCALGAGRRAWPFSSLARPCAPTTAP